MQKEIGKVRVAKVKCRKSINYRWKRILKIRSGNAQHSSLWG